MKFEFLIRLNALKKNSIEHFFPLKVITKKTYVLHFKLFIPI